MNENQQYQIVKYYDGYSFSELTLTDEQIEYGDKIILNGEYDENGNIIFDKDKGQIIQTFTDNDFFLKETKELKTIYTGYKVLLEICY
jgi:hydrogenase maturation factor